MEVPAAEIHGDERNSVFDETAGHQARLAEVMTAVLVSQVVFLLRQVECLFRIAENQIIGLLLEGVRALQHGALVFQTRQGVHALHQRAAFLHARFRHAGRRNEPLHAEFLGVGIAAAGKGAVIGPQKTFGRETPQRLGQRDIRRQVALIAGLFPCVRHHGADRGVAQIGRGRGAGHHFIGGRLVSVVAVGHAANDAVLVGLLGQQRQ